MKILTAILFIAVVSTGLSGSLNTCFSEGEITVKTVNPVVMEKKFTKKMKDNLGEYGIYEYDFKVDTSGQYVFVDSLGSNTNAILYEGSNPLVYDNVAKKPVELIAELEAGKEYKLEVKDYGLKKTSMIAYTVVSDLTGETTYLNAETAAKKPVENWTKIFKYTSTNKEFKTLILDYTDAKTESVNTGNKISVTIHDMKWMPIGKVYYEAHQNTSKQTFNLRLNPGTYYIEAKITSDSISDTAGIAIDEAQRITVDKKVKLKVDGYDLNATAAFTPIVKGSYEFFGDNRITKIVVRNGDKVVGSATGKTVKLNLESDTAYSIYYNMFPSSISDVTIGVRMPSVDLIKTFDKKPLINGSTVKSNVKAIVSDENIESRVIYLNGKEIGLPAKNTFKKEGLYRIRVVDKLANIITYKFTIDKTPPVVTLKDERGQLIKSGFTVNGKVIIDTGKEKLAYKRMFLNGKQTAWPSKSTIARSGEYKILLGDVAGNETLVIVKVKL